MLTLSRTSTGHRAAAVNALRIAVLGAAVSLAAVTAAGPAEGAVTAQWVQPVLTAVRVAHHPGVDRVVFETTAAGPAKVEVGYVSRILADGSGLPVTVPGQAVLRVVLRGVDAHSASGSATVPRAVAYATPGVITTVKASDFEGVVTYGIGLAQRTPFTVTRLAHPSRVVVDIRADFATVTRALYLTDATKVQANRAHPVTAVYRQVPVRSQATGLMDRMYAGPTPAELRRGLTTTLSRSTGYRGLTISADGVARVQLTGGCGGGSAVVSVADQIRPTLKQLRTVHWVKIYAPNGTTEHPFGRSDSIPECLEP